MEKRAQILRKILSANQAAVITSPVNRLYLSGFYSSAGALIITQNNAYFFVDSRYFEKAKREIKHLCVLLSKNIYCEISDILKKENITEIILESDFVTIEGLNKFKSLLSDFKINQSNVLSKQILQMRSIKSETEIESIKAAQTLTDQAFLHILNYIKSGVTELEIALEIELFMRKKGSQGIAFDTIVVSGKNSSLPHGVPTEKTVENGDFITMDFGAVYNGYRSDMTRTVAVGYASDKQFEVYNTVLSAQKNALKKIKPNTVCSSIDKAARDIIEKAGYGECFGHGLGHSVGIQIHETPTLSPMDNSILKSGMTMTVEPGIYLENQFGVRIEDLVVVTENGYCNLTQSPKELILI